MTSGTAPQCFSVSTFLIPISRKDSLPFVQNRFLVLLAHRACKDGRDVWKHSEERDEAWSICVPLRLPTGNRPETYREDGAMPEV